MQNDPTSRRRVPVWLVAVGSAVLGVAIGAGVLSAGAQGEDPDPAPEADRRAAIEAFVDCAEDAGIDLPDVRQHRRDREPLSAEERAAVDAAREACGDLLPHAEERAAFRQCLTDAGVLGPDGERPDRDELTDEERTAFREAARACAAEQGIDRRPRCRPGRGARGAAHDGVPADA
jgi:hypothetical protein